MSHLRTCNICMRTRTVGTGELVSDQDANSTLGKPEFDGESIPQRYPNPVAQTVRYSWTDALLVAHTYCSNSLGTIKCIIHGHKVRKDGRWVWVVTLYEKEEWDAFKVGGDAV